MEKIGHSSGVNDVVELRKKAGKWLRSRRDELGLSQRELARRVNTEYYTFISQIEAGRGRVPAEKILEWSKALELEPREFALVLMKYYDPHMYKLIFEEPAVNENIKVVETSNN